MLYFIPTPIGNREDITVRGLRMLRELRFLICEDTRTTKKLLSMYEIDYSEKQFFSLTSFTDKGKLDHYLSLIQKEEVWLLSEAGTPGLSDPGKLLIQLCNEQGLPYSILPWANALIPAVVGAGFDTSRFVYLGFLPHKKGRQTMLKYACTSDIPVFFYESVHRVEKMFKELAALWFTGKISIGREISKKFEQLYTGSLEEVEGLLAQGGLEIKGEFVIGLSVG